MDDDDDLLDDLTAAPQGKSVTLSVAVAVFVTLGVICWFLLR